MRSEALLAGLEGQIDRPCACKLAEASSGTPRSLRHGFWQIDIRRRLRFRARNLAACRRVAKGTPQRRALGVARLLPTVAARRLPAPARRLAAAYRLRRVWRRNSPLVLAAWRAAPARPRASIAAHRGTARGRRRAAARRAAGRAGRRRAARSATARASASRARPAAGTTAASGSSSRRVLPRPVYKGGVAQWQSVRFACGKPRVQTPAPPHTHNSVAQWIAYQTSNLGVAGSSPVGVESPPSSWRNG